jgi:hypothetical protein
MGYIVQQQLMAGRTLGSLLVSLLREQKVNGLLDLIYGTVKGNTTDLWSWYRSRPYANSPAPGFALVNRLFQLRTVFDHPPVNGGVIHVDIALEHEFFDVARAQRVGHIASDAPQNDFLWDMGTFEISIQTIQ